MRPALAELRAEAAAVKQAGLKIDRGGQPNSRQHTPQGEVPDLWGKRIQLCPNCPPPCQARYDLPEYEGRRLAE
jgi:hypothetical protein